MMKSKITCSRIIKCIIHHSTFIILVLLFTTKGNAQTTVDAVLSSIADNNKTIFSNVQYWEAKKLEYKTGLTPYNPKIDYDYLNGTPETAGNQTDFMVNQSFDFITAYSRKKQLSNEQIAQAEFQMLSTRQNVLLEAKSICMELVYRNKFQAEVTKRQQNTDKWLIDFQTKLDKGEGNILDVNKAKLQLIEINASYQENLSAINQLNQKLTELNGGNPIAFQDTLYADLPTVPEFETLATEIEANDAVRKYLEQEKVIGEKEVALSKAMALPKLETGYRYQAILGQKFQGIHLGMTYFSLTRFYMTCLGISAMAVIMWFFMRKMYQNKKKNIVILAGSFILFVSALVLVRVQAPIIGDVLWMKAMIPHHSIAILTSERADIQDPEVKQLANDIIKAQRKEIEQMKTMINRLENEK